MFMNGARQQGLIAVALALSLTAASVEAQQPSSKPDPARPANPAANLPSDSGSQTTLPSGAVTGAGRAEGKGRQPDVGAPGGLERRARQSERSAQQPAAATAGDAGANASDANRGNERRRSPRRQMKG